MHRLLEEVSDSGLRKIFVLRNIWEHVLGGDVVSDCGVSQALSHSRKGQKHTE